MKRGNKMKLYDYELVIGEEIGTKGKGNNLW